MIIRFSKHHQEKKKKKSRDVYSIKIARKFPKKSGKIITTYSLAFISFFSKRATIFIQNNMTMTWGTQHKHYYKIYNLKISKDSFLVYFCILLLFVYFYFAFFWEHLVRLQYFRTILYLPFWTAKHSMVRFWRMTSSSPTHLQKKQEQQQQQQQKPTSYCLKSCCTIWKHTDVGLLTCSLA